MYKTLFILFAFCGMTWLGAAFPCRRVLQAEAPRTLEMLEIDIREAEATLSKKPVLLERNTEEYLALRESVRNQLQKEFPQWFANGKRLLGRIAESPALRERLDKKERWLADGTLIYSLYETIFEARDHSEAQTYFKEAALRMQLAQMHAEVSWLTTGKSREPDRDTFIANDPQVIEATRRYLSADENAVEAEKSLQVYLDLIEGVSKNPDYAQAIAQFRAQTLVPLVFWQSLGYPRMPYAAGP